MSMIQLENVTKIYKTKEYNTVAVRDITMTARQGEFIFLVGSRGAGKTTLLRLIAGELSAEEGTVLLDGIDVTKYSKQQRARMRYSVGLVRQSPSLDYGKTVQENLVPNKKHILPRSKRRAKPDPLTEMLMAKALSLVGMAGSEERPAGGLTMAERRRVDVARVIMYSPAVLLLDEVTDRVDDDTVWDLMHLVSALNSHGTTVIMATSASRIVNIMRRRVITLSDGKIAGDVPRGQFGKIPRKVQTLFEL